MTALGIASDSLELSLRETLGIYGSEWTARFLDKRGVIVDINLSGVGVASCSHAFHLVNPQRWQISVIHMNERLCYAHPCKTTYDCFDELKSLACRHVHH